MDVGATLQKVRKQLRDINTRVDDLKRSAQEADHADDGISLLQLKAYTLLRYGGKLTRYCAARTRGEGLPADLRTSLCEDWAVLDVARPLERKLRPQLKALLESAESAGDSRGASATVEHRPNPAAMVGASDSESEDDGDAPGTEAYVPPRFAEAVHDATADASAKARAEARKARMRRGAGARAMLAEVRGLPEELRTAGNEAAQMTGEEKARVRYEEDNFVRLAQHKKQRRADAKRRRTADGDEGDGIGALAKLADNVVGGKKKKAAAAAAAGAQQDETHLKVRALDAADAAGATRGRGRGRGRKRRRKE